ncbi:MAG: LLM class flavin-dependent oxidoreductase [Chloroflexi bacterium]|nr:LLM class flavin-dependent oxidoreductase [Chloroflexota bacterium]
MTLDFAIWDHFERQDGIPLNQQYEERIQLIVEAEACGFAGYHVAEHHLTPLDMAPSPTVFLSAVAQRTSRIRLGSMVFCLPLYHPVRLIQEICMLDQISNGRFEPGVGRGVRDVEHEWFSLNPLEARARYAETLEVVRSGLTQGKLAHHGRLFEFDDVPLNCEPLQNPIPFWYAGNIQSAAEQGMNALGRASSREVFDAYWQRWEQGRADGDPLYQREPRVGSTRHLLVADTDEEAYVIAARAWNVYAAHFNATSTRIDGHALERSATIGSGGSQDVAERIAAGVLLAGSPATVRDKLGSYLDRVGPGHNYLVAAFQWGDLTHAEAMRSMELYAAEVMPALRERRIPAGV